VSLTPTERQMRASLAANTRWANTDSGQASEDARRRIDERFENQVDPDRVLEPAERAKRAARAKKAYMTRLALKSAKARRVRA
jgi:hypothetical protein